MKLTQAHWLSLFAIVAATACSSSGGDASNAGGAGGKGGASGGWGTGGTSGKGGTSGTGGIAGTGGTSGTGGIAGTGATAGTGGTAGAGGTAGSGGNGVRVNAIFPPPSGTQEYTNFMQYLATSPWVDGINPGIYWADVDKGPGAVGAQYQWGTVTTALQPFFDTGKTIDIVILPFGYTASSQPPPYVMNDATLDKLQNCPNLPNYPVVYEDAYENAYKAFIQEVLTHFAQNAQIGYIRFGLSRAGEVMPLCASEETTLYNSQHGTNYTQQQWLEQVWVPYVDEMLTYEKSLNPTMQIMGPTTQAGNPDITPLEAASAIKNGFGFGNQGLEKSDIANAPDKCTGDWCALFTQYQGQAPLELQTLFYTDPSGALADGSMQAATGPLPPLISLGLQYHATIFELYYQDLLLGLTPSGTKYCVKNQMGTGTQCNTDATSGGSSVGADYLAALKLAHGM